MSKDAAAGGKGVFCDRRHSAISHELPSRFEGYAYYSKYLRTRKLPYLFNIRSNNPPWPKPKCYSKCKKA